MNLSYRIKRGIAYGSAAGMLAGLIYVGAIQRDHVTEVILWRNCILAGAAIGALAGALVHARLTTRSSATSQDSHEGPGTGNQGQDN